MTFCRSFIRCVGLTRIVRSFGVSRRTKCTNRGRRFPKLVKMMPKYIQNLRTRICAAVYLRKLRLSRYKVGSKVSNANRGREHSHHIGRKGCSKYHLGSHFSSKINQQSMPKSAQISMPIKHHHICLCVTPCKSVILP